MILKYNVLHVLEITIYEHLIMRLNSTMKSTKRWNLTDVDETTVFDLLPLFVKNLHGQVFIDKIHAIYMMEM